MATREVATSVGMLSARDRLPRNRYTVQCNEETFEISKSSGNPMIVRTWEVVQPESVKIGGVDKIIAGVEVKQYLSLKSSNEDGSRDDAKSDKALARLRDENENLGIPTAVIDDENPELKCKGIVADAILSAEEYAQRLDPTPEQLAKGQKFGDPIKDANGKEVKGWRVKLDQILGLSAVTVDRPF